MRTGNIVHLKQKANHSPRADLSRGGSLPGKRSPHGDAVTQPTPPRIRTVRKLCAAVFAHLDASEPRIPVRPIIAGAKRAFLQDLKGGNLVTTPPAYFTEILPNIYWGDTPPDAELCGLPLLMCIGSMSEAMNRYELYKLPISRAALILLFFYQARDLQFSCRRGQWWVRSTPEYQERFGTVVRVRFPHTPPENPLDLDDPLEPSAE